jgi:hypothetical protein
VCVSLHRRFSYTISDGRWGDTRLCTVSVDHNVRQCIPSFSPASERLAMILQLTVPHFRLFTVLALNNIIANALTQVYVSKFFQSAMILDKCFHENNARTKYHTRVLLIISKSTFFTATLLRSCYRRNCARGNTSIFTSVWCVLLRKKKKFLNIFV